MSFSHPHFIPNPFFYTNVQQALCITGLKSLFTGYFASRHLSLNLICIYVKLNNEQNRFNIYDVKLHKLSNLMRYALLHVNWI